MKHFLILFLVMIVGFQSHSKGFLFFKKKFPKTEQEAKQILCRKKWEMVKFKAGLDVAKGSKIKDKNLGMTIEFKMDGSAELHDANRIRKADYIYDKEHQRIIIHRSGTSKALIIYSLKKNQFKMKPEDPKEAYLAEMTFTNK